MEKDDPEPKISEEDKNFIKSIVGEEISDEKITKLLLGAGGDVNVAINHYFGEGESESAPETTFVEMNDKSILISEDSDSESLDDTLEGSDDEKDESKEKIKPNFLDVEDDDEKMEDAVNKSEKIETTTSKNEKKRTFSDLDNANNLPKPNNIKKRKLSNTGRRDSNNLSQIVRIEKVKKHNSYTNATEDTIQEEDFIDPGTPPLYKPQSPKKVEGKKLSRKLSRAGSSFIFDPSDTVEKEKNSIKAEKILKEFEKKKKTIDKDVPLVFKETKLEKVKFPIFIGSIILSPNRYNLELSRPNLNPGTKKPSLPEENLPANFSGNNSEINVTSIRKQFVGNSYNPNKEFHFNTQKYGDFCVRFVYNYQNNNKQIKDILDNHKAFGIRAKILPRGATGFSVQLQFHLTQNHINNNDDPNPESIKYAQLWRHLWKELKDQDQIQLGKFSNNFILSEEEIEDEEYNKKFSLFELFESIKPPQNSIPIEDPEDISCQLRKFQRKAVHWMIKRETISCLPNKELHPAWEHVVVKDAAGKNQDFYLNKKVGSLSNNYFSSPGTHPGGLLCEEMGLGKTVEMISLLLLHKRENCKPDFTNQLFLENFKESQQKKREEEEKKKKVDAQQTVRRSSRVKDKGIIEESKKKTEEYEGQPEPVPIGASLIITPQSILHQWVSELEVHGPALKVYYYTGMNNCVDPRKFLEYDIVVTTYTVLTRDLKLHKKLRPTPLICVEWWRVVLDEAQMVSNSNTETSHMAACLWAANRWACTGTPIAHEIDDLYGLLDFLYHNPYADRKLWNTALCQPFDSKKPEGLAGMRHFLRSIMWRHTKEHVKDELGLPPITYHNVELTLSDIEATYYNNMYRELRLESERTRFQGGINLAKLTQLRQACCHPQLVTRDVPVFGNEMLSMKEIMHRMMDKAHTDHETAIREHISTLNKAASMYARNAPYKEVLIHEDGEREKLCQNPPKENPKLALELFEKALALNKEQSQILKGEDLTTLKPEDITMSIRAWLNLEAQTLFGLYELTNDAQLFKKAHKIYDNLNIEKEEKGTPITEYIWRKSGISRNREFTTHQPEKTFETTETRCIANITETKHHLIHMKNKAIETGAYVPEKGDVIGLEIEKKQQQDKDLQKKINEDLSESDAEGASCPICYEEFENVATSVVTKCAHIFCAECIYSYIEVKGNIQCPVCREPLRKEDLTEAVPENVIEEEREKEEKKLEATTIKGKKLEDENIEDFGTKVCALVYHLRKLKQKDPTAKSVIFSQWNKLLDLIKAALVKMNISYRQLSGTEQQRTNAIHDFQNDPDVTVFLISMKWSAGLTLTQANRVFLMEPASNPALAEQAVNRVYRIGQAQPTHVYRLIIKNSIEEKMLAIQDRKRSDNSIQQNDEVFSVDEIKELFENQKPNKD